MEGTTKTVQSLNRQLDIFSNMDDLGLNTEPTSQSFRKITMTESIGITKYFEILCHNIANGSEMTRKFLFCFPLRVGNIVFGYTVIIIAIAVMIYNLYCLTVTLLPEENEVPDTKFKNWKHLEELFGTDKESLVLMVTLIYHSSYVVIGFLLMVFGALFTCGAHKASYCPVTTFFVYSFFHLFLTIGLVVWEATSGGYIQLGLIVLTDVLLIICLFGVKNLMEAINRGYIYSHPGEELYKY